MKAGNIKRRTGPATAGRAEVKGFQANPFYERLLEIKEKNPKLFGTLSTATRAALEAYVSNRSKLPSAS